MPDADRVTVRMLLAHTSGYPDVETDEPLATQLDISRRAFRPARVWNRAGILARQRAAKAANAPSIELPRPTEPIDADLPATLRDTLQVVGASVVGAIVLAALIGTAASRAWGG